MDIKIIKQIMQEKKDLLYGQEMNHLNIEMKSEEYLIIQIIKMVKKLKYL